MMNGVGAERAVAGYDGRILAAAGQSNVSAGKMLVESYTNDILAESERKGPPYNPVSFRPRPWRLWCRQSH